MKIRRAVRGPLHALFLLSTSVTTSRSRRTNVAANLGGQGHFFDVAYYFFRKGFNERPPTLDRQRRTPTKGRIRNTPKKGTVTRLGAEPIKEQDRPSYASFPRLQAPSHRVAASGRISVLVMACLPLSGRRLRRAFCGVQPGTSQATALHQTKTERRPTPPFTACLAFSSHPPARRFDVAATRFFAGHGAGLCLIPSTCERSRN